MRIIWGMEALVGDSLNLLRAYGTHVSSFPCTGYLWYSPQELQMSWCPLRQRWGSCPYWFDTSWCQRYFPIPFSDYKDCQNGCTNFCLYLSFHNYQLPLPFPTWMYSLYLWNAIPHVDQSWCSLPLLFIPPSLSHFEQWVSQGHIPAPSIMRRIEPEYRWHWSKSTSVQPALLASLKARLSSLLLSYLPLSMLLA